MKTSVTVTFTGLFIAVAALYFFFGNPSRPEVPSVSENGSLKLLELDKDAITWIQIQKPETKETVTIEKANGQWFLKYPVNYLADKMMIEGLSLALRFSNKARRLVREKGWEEYGLLQPRLKIGIQASGLSKRKYLLLGDPSPVAAAIFARWEDEKDYFLLESRFKDSFDRSLYSLREKRVIRLPLNDVQKIHVRTPTGNFELSQEKEGWVWTEPVAQIGLPIAREKIYEILISLRELYVKEFLDQQAAQKPEHGFSVTGPYIQVWDKNQNTGVVRFGNEVQGHDAYYGMIEGEEVVLEVAKRNVEKFFSLFE